MSKIQSDQLGDMPKIPQGYPAAPSVATEPPQEQTYLLPNVAAAATQERKASMALSDETELIVMAAMFVIGWFTGITWIVGALLPPCLGFTKPRDMKPPVKVFWILNVVMTITIVAPLLIFFVIWIISVLIALVIMVISGGSFAKDMGWIVGQF